MSQLWDMKSFMTNGHNSEIWSCDYKKMSHIWDKSQLWDIVAIKLQLRDIKRILRSVAINKVAIIYIFFLNVNALP